jgi:hypothetical protein
MHPQYNNNLKNKERVKEGKCGGDILPSCVKMEK